MPPIKLIRLSCLPNRRHGDSQTTKYKIAIGASQNSVTWLSLIKGKKRLGKAVEGWPSQDKVQDEVRLNSQNTPQILSPVEEREFWLDWKLDHAHVAQLQLGRSIQRGQGNTGYGNSNIGD